MIFSKRLKELRMKKNATQKDIADLLQISPSTFGMYEQGRREPDYQTLQKLADFFEVSIDYLLGRTDERRPVDKIVFNQSKNQTSNEEIAELIKQISALSPESKKDLEKQIKLLKIRDSLDDTSNETSSTLEESC